MPKVSVIIPIYQVEDFIERCARSLFEQTLDDMEYIFVDDCTPDESIKELEIVLNDYPHRVKQTKIIRHDKNMGLPYARKSGLTNAKGDFVAHCDSDDWVEPTIYEKLYKAAIEQHADVVVCDYFESDGLGVDKRIFASNDVSASKCMFKDALIQKISSSVWNKLVRRNLVPSDHIVYAESNMGEDYVLTIQNMYYAKKVAVVNEPLYYYYFNENSITKQMTAEKIFSRFEQSVRNMLPITKFMKQEGICEKYQKELDKLKFAKRNNLLPVIHDGKYYRIWKSTFPEINVRILWNPYIRFNEKLKYILTYLRIAR